MSVKSILTSVTAVVALVIGVLTAVPATAEVSMPAQSASVSTSLSEPALGGPVKTADLSKFQPGNIISDAVFFNSGTMSEAQIQTFLESKMPSCRSGYTCLKDWYDLTRTTTADAMCGAYQGGTTERASRIIYKVAQACGINPQVILVMLQKEQGLVLSSAPSAYNYRAAMGQGCPDTADCDVRYYGFFNQVQGAAWQFKRYANPVGTTKVFTWYAPGKTWNVRYHPNADCGSSPVYIQNQATANLYYYTPYQPNAAALSAGYSASSDPCSSYGNRNFFQFFTDWFGSTQSSVQGEPLQVVQVAGTSERYLLSEGGRWRLQASEIAAQFTWISSLRDVSRLDLDLYQDRGIAERAVRTSSGGIFLLDGGRRLRLGAAYLAAEFGWDSAALPLAGDAQVARYGDGGYLERVVSSGGQSWLLQGGSRRQVVDLGLLPRYGIPAASTPVSEAMVSEYPISSPVVGLGVYRDASNPPRVITEAGIYTLPDAAIASTVGQSARLLAPESFAYLRASSALPVRLTSGGVSYIMVESGWLEVLASHYPAGLQFTSLPGGSAAGLPAAGRAVGPHYIREKSDAQVYLVSGGGMQAVSAADQVWITRAYGVNPYVWVALDGAISDAVAPEGIVRTSSGAAYLLDGTRAYRFRDCGQVASWGGDCATLAVVSDAKISGYANAGFLQHLVRTPAGTTWLPQGGQARQVLDAGILSVYGIPSTTSAVSVATAAKLPVGPPVLAAGVYSDGASAHMAVTEGGSFTLAPEQVAGVIRLMTRSLTAASYAQLVPTATLPSRIRSDGRSLILTQEGWLEVAAAAYGGDSVFSQLPSRAWTGIVLAGYEPRPHFVRDDANAVEYLISGGAAQPVSSSERSSISARYGVPPKVWNLVGGALSGVRINYDLLAKGPSGEVYLIDGTTRFRANGCGTATDFGKDCATLRTLTSGQLAGTTDGGNLAALLRSADGYVYLPQSGVKREVPDPRVLAVYGVGTTSTAVSAQVLAQLPLSHPVVSAGVYDDRKGDVRVVTGDGRVFTIPPSSRIGSVTSTAWTISPESVDLLTAERDLPTRIVTGSQSYVLTNEGWLAVNPSSYTPLAFASIGANAHEGIRSAGSVSGAHFVREQSSSQIYLASGGLSTVADEATRAWISATYGVPAKVWVAVDGALR